MKRVKTRKKSAKTTFPRSWKRGIFLIVILVVLSAAGWLGYSYYQEKVVKPNSPIAIVNGEVVTTRSYLQTFEYRRYLLYKRLYALQDQKDTAMSDDQSNAALSLDAEIRQVEAEMYNLTFQLLQDMIDETLIKQEAKNRGLIVTSDEVDIHAREIGLRDIGMAGEPQDLSEATFASYLQEIGISARDHYQIAEADLYRQKLQALLEDDLEVKREQVRIQGIVVDDMDKANEAFKRATASEDFAGLIQEYNEDAPGLMWNGALEWFPRGVLDAPIDEEIFSLQVGEIVGVGPVGAAPGWYYVIRIVERDSDRELAPEMVDQARRNALFSWLAQARESSEIKRYLSSDKLPWWK